MRLIKILIIISNSLLIINCSPAQHYREVEDKIVYSWQLKVGAERTELYFPLLKNKKIAVVANQSSVIGHQASVANNYQQSSVSYTNIVDSLISSGFTIKEIFSPEHGFSGNAEAGEILSDSTFNIQHSTLKIPVISLYGKNKKPSKESLRDIDMVIYDLQDVGVRFFTYISTLHYLMEACAEEHIPLLILDRPDPNGFYVDGPVLQKNCRSFVGLDPVPIVYGMTVAEYARMLNEESWLEKGKKCDLKYVTVDNYDHKYYYRLPVPPSPNLPDMEAVYLYPSLGLFEGTVISVGRGTDAPFRVIGHPDFAASDFSFTPHSIKGKSLNPPYKDIVCNGYNLKDFGESYIKNLKKLYLFWLIESYKELKDKTNFFNDFFDRLAGTVSLKHQIIKGMNEEEIRKTWSKDLENFKQIRKKYLLYPDFE
jgi:uncharacterized protein YbbC (DUF1343 family)